MPLLDGDWAGVLLACAEGRLDQAPELNITSVCSACVVAAAQGYPEATRLGDRISDSGADLSNNDSCSQLFHAGVRADNGNLHTSGGRVLAAVAQGEDFNAAFSAAYSRLAQVNFDGMHFRRDIGHQVRRP